MAFSVNTLTAYVEENKSELVMKPIVGSRTFDLVDVRQGIKSGDKIPILESTAPAQSGATCGFNSSGTTSVTQTTLTTTSIKIEEALCLEDLEAYFTQKYLPAGSNPETISIEGMIVERKVANIATKVGQMVWQGKTTYTNDTYLKQLNGWIALIDANSGSTIAATQQTSVTSANIIGIVNEIVFQKLPLAIADLGDQAVIMGVDNYRLLIQAMITANNYHIMPNSAEYKANEMLWPGTNVRIIGLNELNASNTVDSGGSLPTAVKNRIFGGSLGNFIAGFDVKKDNEDFKIWWSEDNQQLRFRCRFRIGVTNHWYDQIVQYTNL